MSKIPGEYYFEYPSGVIPQDPPFTTWSGLLAVPPDSPHASRLQNKCGGTVMSKTLVRKRRNPDGTLYKKKVQNVKGEEIDEEVELTIGDKGWIMGFWTSPEDWPEMAAGREDATPFSPKTHDRTRK